MYESYFELRPKVEQSNGLMWEIDENGYMWAGWGEWDRIEEESPIFYRVGLDRSTMSLEGKTKDKGLSE